VAERIEMDNETTATPEVRITKTYSVSLRTASTIKVIARLQEEKTRKHVFDASVLEQAIDLLYEKVKSE
jgi:hypothetical protein